MLACPECGMELKAAFLESSEYRDCQVCGSELSVMPYPAYYAPAAAIRTAELYRQDGEAACFHHEGKRAVAGCLRCGKFLCRLCRVDAGAEVLCPECLLAGGKAGTDRRLETTRKLWDSMALIVAVASWGLIWTSILGAPAAIYLVLRYWKQPPSLVGGWRWQRWAALAVGLGTIAIWVFTVGLAITARGTAK